MSNLLLFVAIIEGKGVSSIQFPLDNGMQVLEAQSEAGQAVNNYLKAIKELEKLAREN